MKGACLKLYMQELTKHHGILLYEWILEKAKKMGVPGGSVFRAIAGYGRDGVIHEEHFLELASNVPVELELVASTEQIQQFLHFLEQEHVHLFYVILPVEFGGLDNKPK